MAWWSRVKDKIEKHDGRQPKMWALFRINVARTVENIPIEECAIYRRDPAKQTDPVNELPALIEQERQRRLAKDIRRIMGATPKE